MQIGICDKRSVKYGIEQDQKDVVREGDDQGKLQSLLLEPIVQYEYHIAYRPSEENVHDEELEIRVMRKIESIEIHKDHRKDGSERCPENPYRTQDFNSENEIENEKRHGNSTMIERKAHLQIKISGEKLPTVENHLIDQQNDAHRLCDTLGIAKF